MKQRRSLLWATLAITFLSLLVDLPAVLPISFSLAGKQVNWEIRRPRVNLRLGKSQFAPDLEIKKGIDLAGGAQIVFQANMAPIGEADRDSALQAAEANIRRRVDLFGISEAVVQTSKLGDDYRLIVELPGVEDISQAVGLIGQTAMLDFRQLAPGATASDAASLQNFLPTDLTGADLARSQVDFDPETSEPVVGLEFSAEGAQKFAAITQANVGKPVAIFLDNLPLMTPRVDEPITGGRAIIRGQFTVEEAKTLSAQLNAGALPVPIEMIHQRNIGATLGEASVQKSIRAGLIGLVMVILFMAVYYGRLGLLADAGLVIYGLLTLALYKLIPVTLTLPGVAGFLLSMGMAVDSNILIFERMKDEQRLGKSRPEAMELGFGRAWDSIRDANVCTLIICFILFNPFSWPFLNTSGLVRGFALTLSLGVFLSLFTGVVVSRALLRTFMRYSITDTRYSKRLT